MLQVSATFITAAKHTLLWFQFWLVLVLAIQAIAEDAIPEKRIAKRELLDIKSLKSKKGPLVIYKPLPFKQPVPIPFIKKVPVPYKVPVPVKIIKPLPVFIPKPVPVPIVKPFPVKVIKKVPYPVKVPAKGSVSALKSLKKKKKGKLDFGSAEIFDGLKDLLHKL